MSVAMVGGGIRMISRGERDLYLNPPRGRHVLDDECRERKGREKELSLYLGVYGSGQLNTVSSSPTRTLTQNLAYTSDVENAAKGQVSALSERGITPRLVPRELWMT